MLALCLWTALLAPMSISPAVGAQTGTTAGSTADASADGVEGSGALTDAVLGAGFGQKTLHARAVSNDGTIVGSMRSDLASGTVGYFRLASNGALHELDMLAANDINDSGVIVGTSTSCDSPCAVTPLALHAAWATTTNTDSTPMFTGDGYSVASHVNNAGIAIGVRVDRLGGRSGFVFDTTSSKLLDVPTFNGDPVIPVAINDEGLIVGYAITVDGPIGVYYRLDLKTGFAIAMDEFVRVDPADVDANGLIIGMALSDDGSTRPFSFDVADQQLTDLSNVVGEDAVVTALSNEGRIVGSRRMPGPALVCDVTDSVAAPGHLYGRAFVADLTSQRSWDLQLSPFDGDCERSEATAINDDGDVVGTFAHRSDTDGGLAYDGFVVTGDAPAVRAPRGVAASGCVDGVTISWNAVRADDESSTTYVVGRAGPLDPLSGIDLGSVSTTSFVDSNPLQSGNERGEVRYWVRAVQGGEASIAATTSIQLDNCDSEPTTDGEPGVDGDDTGSDQTPVTGERPPATAADAGSTQPGPDEAAISTSSAVGSSETRTGESELEPSAKQTTTTTRPTATDFADVADGAEGADVSSVSPARQSVDIVAHSGPLTQPGACASGPEVSLASPSVPQNGTVGISGSCWKPRSAVVVVMHSSPTILGTFGVDENGRVMGDAFISCNKAPGAHTLTMSGTDRTGAKATARTTFAVAAGGCRADVAGARQAQPAANAVPNARTGAQARTVINMSLAMLVAGACALGLSATLRRRSAP